MNEKSLKEIHLLYSKQKEKTDELLKVVKQNRLDECDNYRIRVQELEQEISAKNDLIVEFENQIEELEEEIHRLYRKQRAEGIDDPNFVKVNSKIIIEISTCS